MKCDQQAENSVILYQISTCTMYTLASRIVFIALILSFSYNLHAHVVLDYPQGGETFIVGEVVTIQWHIAVPHMTLNWDLYFSADAGATWEPIQLNIPVSQLSYSWAVPDTATSLGRVRVFMNNEGQDYHDISMDFTIAPNSMPPLLDAPAQDTTIECSVINQETAIQAWLNNHGGAVVTNYCGNLNWTNNYDILSNGCGASGSAIVTFTATDECGSTVTTALLTIADTNHPVIDVPAIDMVVQCDGQGNLADLNNWLDNRGGALATDACGNVSWTNNYSTLSNGCGSTGSASVIFSATDDCGNIATTAAAFTIEDHVAPNIVTAARDTTIECGASNQDSIIQKWLDQKGGALASDVCGNVSWTNNYLTLSNGCGSTGSTSVIFSATDDCGNIATTAAAFTVEDRVAPNIVTAARDTTIECGASNQDSIIQTWLDQHGGAIAIDICGNVSWTHDFPVISDTCDTTVSHIITFTAFDECLNSTAVHVTFTILGPSTTSTLVIPDFAFNLFPNPVSEILTIDFDKSESVPVHLTLFDTYGKPIWVSQDKARVVHIPVSKYAPGVYFLHIEVAQNAFSRMIIIE